MHLAYVLLALLAAPFWETKAPGDWTDVEIERLLHDSPWAQMADPAPAVQVYLATAHPLREAEAEWARRRGKPLSEEYVDYIGQEGAHRLVVAIAYDNLTALADGEEAHRMEEESIMKVGRRKYQMEGTSRRCRRTRSCGWSSRGWQPSGTGPSFSNCTCRDTGRTTRRNSGCATCYTKESWKCRYAAPERAAPDYTIVGGSDDLVIGFAVHAGFGGGQAD